MKILVLGPMDYPTARADLILFNYNQNVYSTNFLVEGMANKLHKDAKMENLSSMMLYFAAHMTDKEYESSTIFFGTAPKKYAFDIIICYDKNTISTQEAYELNLNPYFNVEFYTTADTTHYCANIMEAIKLAQSKAVEGYN